MGLAKELRGRRSVSARTISVVEWGEGGEPFEFFCYPITCYDLSALQKKHPDFMQNTTIDAMVDLIVMKAADEGGNKLFKAADRIDLMGEETHIISDIANQMFAQIESAEVIEKN